MDEGLEAVRPQFTCPRCELTSHNPGDVKEGYCGNCHDWTAVPISSAALVVHAYVSTYCQHERHGDCRLNCKLCEAACLCPCHPRPEATP
jgi:hypothetical protein